MSRLVALGVATVASVIAFQCLRRQSHHQPASTVGDWITKRMAKHMDHMMASLPEGAPPKLVVSVLPKLQAQNEQIIAMLREQNELLRTSSKVHA